MVRARPKVSSVEGAKGWSARVVQTAYGIVPPRDVALSAQNANRCDDHGRLGSGAQHLSRVPRTGWHCALHDRPAA